MGCHFLLQGIVLTPGLNPLLHQQTDSLPLSHLGSPYYYLLLILFPQFELYTGKNNLPMQEIQKTLVWSLAQEDPLEGEVATHSSILAEIIPWTKEPGGLLSMGSQTVGHNWSNWAWMHGSFQLLSCVWLLVTPWTAALVFPVHHRLLELAQTHFHRAIQPSHLLSSPSPAFNLS